MAETWQACPACRKPIPNNAQICRHCGVALSTAKPCPQCRQIAPSDARFCQNCGFQFQEGSIASYAPTPMPQPTSSNTGRNLIGAIVALFFLFGGGGVLYRAGVTGSTGVTASSPANPATLLDLSGSGNQTTQMFTTQADNWDMAWTYNCNNFGQYGSFDITVSNSDGSLTWQDVGVSETALSSGLTGSGTEHYHTGGTLYLQVGTECNWTVTATG